VNSELLPAADHSTRNQLLVIWGLFFLKDNDFLEETFSIKSFLQTSFKKLSYKNSASRRF
jgi:hypothetical protein